MEKAAETSLPTLGLPPSRTGTAEGAAHAANLPTDQTTRHHPKTEAGKSSESKQPHVSALMRNRAGSFSVERLMDFLTLLGQDIEITVRPTEQTARGSFCGGVSLRVVESHPCIFPFQTRLG